MFFECQMSINPYTSGSKFRSVLLSLVCFAALATATDAQDYAHIDRHALSAPKSATASIPKLSAYLSGSPAQNDAERLRAIYAWVTQNIAYVDSTDGSDLWSTPADIRRQRAEQVLQNRTAVCLGYANLFRALAMGAGIPCEVVGGIVKKTDGNVARLGHAWPVAKVGREWALFDPTWGIPAATGTRGTVDDRYFMASPAFFILEHLPDDPVWQLLENPIHEQQFRNMGSEALRRLVGMPAAAPFYYQDTLKHWLQMDSMGRTYSAAFRILHFNAGNERVLFQLGRTFYRNFYDLYLTLDSIARDHIYELKYRIDSTRFLKQLGFMQQLQSRAADLFDQIRERERRAKAQDLFSRAEAGALADKLRGDLWMALFQHAFETGEEASSEKALEQLAFFQQSMAYWYGKALPFLSVERFENERRDILNHGSIACVQLGGRYLRFVQSRVDNAAWQAKNPGTLTRNIEKAKDWLRRADSTAHELFTRPWYLGVLRDRLVSIRQNQITAVVLENRLATNALRPQIKTLFAGDQIEATAFKNLLGDLRDTRRAIVIGIDSIEKNSLPLDPEFKKVMRTNLLHDLLEMQSQEGNACYRMAYQLYRNATGQLPPEQKQAVLSQLEAAASALDQSLKTLRKIETNGKSTAAQLARERQQLTEVKEAVRQLAEAVK